LIPSANTEASGPIFVSNRLRKSVPQGPSNQGAPYPPCGPVPLYPWSEPPRASSVVPLSHGGLIWASYNIRNRIGDLNV
jgi:hypothetical protein